jgi:amidase
MGDLWRLSATEQARVIAQREATSAEVVDAHLARIDAVNPTLNAITEVLADQARAAANEADRAVAANDELGPLHGVPFTVKQNIDLAGSATNWGLPALAEAVPAADSPVVERMRRAGAIPIGRTNCPDMALRVHTDSGLHGLTRNPWRADVTAGGSSGGEASALAAGMSPIGLGNDIGGSLRNPAACCGIASLKPSAGAVPGYTTIPGADGVLAFQLMPVEGPMARTVADVRLGFGILAGRDRRDPYSVPAPPRPPQPQGRPLRAALLAEPPGGDTDPRVAAQTTRAADALADAGYDVVTTPPPRYEDVIATWTDFIVSDIRMMRDLIAPMMSPDAIGFLDGVLDARPALDLAAYAGVLMARQGLMREWALWFGDVDVLLTPTWAQLPFAHGWDVEASSRPLETLEMMRPVMPANVLGLPSACVPAGLVDGLPVGVLLTADRFADETALDAAAVIEAALGLATPIDPIT